MNNEWTITNHTAFQRFEVRVGDQIAMLNYRIDGSRVTFFHAGVPQSLDGRGIGSAMAFILLKGEI